MVTINDFVTDMRDVDGVESFLEKSQDSRPDISNSARNGLRAYAHSVASKRAGYTKTADKLSEEEIQREVSNGMKLAKSRASDRAVLNTDDFVNGMSEAALERAAGRKETLIEANGDNKELLEKYFLYNTLKDFATHYEAGGSARNEQEEKQIQNSVAIKAGKAERERLEALGYRSTAELDFAEGAAQATSGNLDEATTRTYAIEGLREALSEIRKEYGSIDDVKEAARETIRELLNSDDHKKFDMGRDITFASQANKMGYLDRHYNTQ